MAAFRIASSVAHLPTLQPSTSRGSVPLGGRTRVQIRHATADGDRQAEPSTSSTATAADVEKEDLAAKLAAAEAEAEALRKELAARRGGNASADLSKLKPAAPEKRIDGTGYRETLFSGPGTAATGSTEQQSKKWGLSEAELFLSKGAPTEGTGLAIPAMDEGSDDLVRRRLIIGVGVTGVAGALAFVKFPRGRPPKPLFFYLISIIRLGEQLQLIEDSSSDAGSVRAQLRRAYGSPDSVKDDFLSVVAFLEGADADRASQLAYAIFEYLDQADYSKYFENLGEPTSTQQVEFLQFSLQSIKAARERIDEFVRLAPSESLEAALLQAKE